MEQSNNITESNNGEKKVWQGHSSQILNFNVFLVCGLLTIVSVGILGIGLIPYMIWKYLEIKNQKYVLTNQRLFTYTGVLNKLTDELELYRVRDTKFIEPFFLRIFGLGIIEIHSSDSSTPFVYIQAVKNGREIREQLRSLVEYRRESKNVRMAEVD